ncbi:hypothetical protein HZB00_00825 [Candidatus Woesearchaeota archaeon]|nr:hypothetical protein [Candidatus Woesearchaeota archaeon]
MALNDSLGAIAETAGGLALATGSAICLVKGATGTAYEMPGYNTFFNSVAMGFNQGAGGFYMNGEAFQNITYCVLAVAGLALAVNGVKKMK